MPREPYAYTMQKICAWSGDLRRQVPLPTWNGNILHLTLLLPCIRTLRVKRRRNARRNSLSKSSYFQTSSSTRPRSSESQRFTYSQPLSEFTGLLRDKREMSLVSAASCLILIPTRKAQESRASRHSSQWRRDTVRSFHRIQGSRSTGAYFSTDVPNATNKGQRMRT